MFYFGPMSVRLAVVHLISARLDRLQASGWFRPATHVFILESRLKEATWGLLLLWHNKSQLRQERKLI